MVVTIIDNPSRRDNREFGPAKDGLVMKSDLVLIRTDEEDWENDTLYRITKSRFSDTGQLVPERKIQELVQLHEEWHEKVTEESFDEYTGSETGIPVDLGEPTVEDNPDWDGTFPQ